MFIFKYKWIERFSNRFIFVSIILPIGSYLDPPQKHGISHLLEHVLFFSILSQLPMFVRDHSSARTGKDQMIFEFCIPRDDFEKNMYTILDNIYSVSLPESIFETQKIKVIEEILYLKPSKNVKVVDEMEEYIYAGSNMNNSLGELKDVENIDYKEFQCFYNDIISKEINIDVILCGKKKWMNPCLEVISTLETKILSNEKKQNDLARVIINPLQHDSMQTCICIIIKKHSFKEFLCQKMILYYFRHLNNGGYCKVMEKSIKGNWHIYLFIHSKEGEQKIFMLDLKDDEFLELKYNFLSELIWSYEIQPFVFMRDFFIQYSDVSEKVKEDIVGIVSSLDLGYFNILRKGLVSNIKRKRSSNEQ